MIAPELRDGITPYPRGDATMFATAVSFALKLQEFDAPPSQIETVMGGEIGEPISVVEQWNLELWMAANGVEVLRDDPGGLVHGYGRPYETYAKHIRAAHRRVHVGRETYTERQRQYEERAEALRQASADGRRMYTQGLMTDTKVSGLLVTGWSVIAALRINAEDKELGGLKPTVLFDSPHAHSFNSVHVFDPEHGALLTDQNVADLMPELDSRAGCLAVRRQVNFHQ